MPPKKKPDGPSKKTEMKKKEKVIEVNLIFIAPKTWQNSNLKCFFKDKTFGLKNKKGGKQQKFIAQVEKQVKSGGDPRARKIEEERAAEKKRKEEAKREEEEKKALFRPVATQKVENGKKTVFLNPQDIKKKEETREEWRRNNEEISDIKKILLFRRGPQICVLCLFQTRPL